MKDEEYVLRQDNRDRAVTARSARNKRTHCGRGGRVKLPSDYMTKKEIHAMNGECKTYRLNEPMTWGEFMRMPDEHKVTYIKLIRQKWNAPDSQMANMFGVNQVTVSKEFQRLGHASGQRSGRTKWDKEGFLAWVHGVPVQAEETPDVVAQDIRVEIPVEPAEEVVETPVPKMASCMPRRGSMNFTGNADEIANTIRTFFSDTKLVMCIEWIVEEDDG